MASAISQRQIVAAEMAATTPRRTTSAASSAMLQRDRGTPDVAGSSQASALTSATTLSGKDRRPTGARLIVEAVEASLEEPLPPAMHHLRARVEPNGDLPVRQAIRRHQRDLGSHHPVVRIRVRHGP